MRRRDLRKPADSREIESLVAEVPAVADDGVRGQARPAVARHDRLRAPGAGERRRQHAAEQPREDRRSASHERHRTRSSARSWKPIARI